MVNKNAVELVTNQNSLGFYNWLFLVPKPNNQWRPILDLSISTLNTFLNTESFKMETPETIRDIPIHSQSRKYMHFHLHGRSYQFKALPFSLSTAPMEFTVVTKEVKLMALQRGIGIHQYLDDWLLRPSNLSPAFRDLSSSLSRTWLAGEQGEVRTGSKTGFQLRRLPVRLEKGQSQTHTRVLADSDRQNSNNSVQSGSSCPS